MMYESEVICLEKKMSKTRSGYFSFFLDILTNIGQMTFYLFYIFPLRYVLNVKVGGYENVCVKKPFLIIANHQSMYDSFLVLSAMGIRNFLMSFPWRSPIAKSLYELPIVKVASKCIGLYKIEPKGSLSESLEETLGYMRNKYSVFFFPEGKMVREGEQAEVKRGLGYLCFNQDAHILPARIIYKGYKRNGFGRVFGSTVVFGKTIESSEARMKYDFSSIHQKLMDNVFCLKYRDEKTGISLVRKRGFGRYFFNNS
jgi:1-acyl-sn-glycerol-3-phosphate acyltransferase